MRAQSFFAQPTFGPRLGSPIPIRKLGQGCIEPAQGGSGGCRDVIPCPKGPATGNNPDGAAAPGQGRRYTLVDYKTGELIKADVGDEIWNQYSVTSLPDAWVCEDPRCKPYCGQQPQTCQENQVWDEASKACIERPAEVETPSGRNPAACRAADGSWDLYDPDTRQFIKNVRNVIVNGQDFPDAPSSIASSGFCDTVSKGGSIPEPTPAPAPAPAAAPQPEGPVPLTIDIQAFTPGGMGPIPAQPLMQPTPIMQPKPPQPVVKAPPPPPAPAPVAKEPESKPLETGSAIGIGLVALTAIAAAVFGGGK